jgi:hypothetical protein
MVYTSYLEWFILAIYGDLGDDLWHCFVHIIQLATCGVYITWVF